MQWTGKKRGFFMQLNYRQLRAKKESCPMDSLKQWKIDARKGLKNGRENRQVRHRVQDLISCVCENVV